MSTFLQVVPINGYVIHAVPEGRERHGLWEQNVMGTTACKKLRGRDAQGFPSLQLQFSAGPERVAKPFSRDASDFEITKWGSRKICPDCARAVTASEDA